MTKDDDQSIFDLQLPESVLLDAKKMATYAGLSFEEFILSAIREKLMDGEYLPSLIRTYVKNSRSTEIEVTKAHLI
jgi:hypothetical protein